MTELFRLQIAAKRQVTIPRRLMDMLKLSQGDELQITVNGREATLTPMTTIPTSLVSHELLQLLKARERGIKDGHFIEVSGPNFMEQMRQTEVAKRPEAHTSKVLQRKKKKMAASSVSVAPMEAMASQSSAR